MPDTWLGVGGVPRRLVDPVVGTASGVRAVQKIWAGSAGGVPVLVFERFTGIGVRVARTSDSRWDRLVVSWDSLGAGVTYTVKQGERVVVSGLAGLTVTDQGLLPDTGYGYSVEGWRNGVLVGGGSGSGKTPALVLELSVAQVSWSSLKLSWDAVAGLSGWKVLRGTAGGTGNHSEVGDVTDPAATSWTDTGLSSNARYYYTLRAVRSGTAVAATDGSHSQVTKTRQLITDVVDCGVLAHASYYNKDTLTWRRREDAEGLSRCYYGRYDGNWGTQMSQVIFDIPDKVRDYGGCVRITGVAIKWWNRHHAQGNDRDGQPLGRVSMVAHHNGSLTSYGGNTGPLLMSNGAQAKWPAPKPGWIENERAGHEWYQLGWLTATPYNRSMDVEIRVGGLRGFGLVEAVSGQGGYGYGAVDPVLRITYQYWEP